MPITFYYDLNSPYAWLAAERIHGLTDAQVDWVPVLLGGIFRATGRGSWALTDARAKGIADIEQRAAARGLPPIRWPEPWPNDGLTAMRLATYADTRGLGRRFALEAFRCSFLEGRTLSHDATLARAAGPVPACPRRWRGASR